jgi:demethylmenaquinone methyltransferase / 2-methoxy-6-polyprenyl-1,4-benzoquinol methylase
MKPPILEKLPGTRPKGARDEREAAARVRGMFSQIAPRYDFLNHLLSFSLDRAWRSHTAQRFHRILRRTDARVLDLCCGTGDLAFALERERVRAIRDAGAYCSSIIGGDFAEPMLERAHKKVLKSGGAVAFLAADALHLPFADASFDLVAVAFGFRNLANYDAGLREIARIERPGGEIGILEFSEPPDGWTNGLFRVYFRHVLPWVGGVISGNMDAYAYLPGSVSKFPSPADLSARMEKTGFTDVRINSWNFGTVNLLSGRRG